jgi:replicative DNA helicase
VTDSESAPQTLLADVEAEQAVLGSVLLDPSCLVRVAGILAPEDFFREAHHLVYQSMLALHDRGAAVDVTTVRAELESTGNYKRLGGELTLIDLLTNTPTAAHAEHYARIVESWSVRRRIVQAAARIAATANVTGDATALVETSQRLLFRASQRKGVNEARPLSDAIAGFLDETRRRRGEGEYNADEPEDAAESDHAPIPTGFLDLDRILGGLHPGDLVIVAARPGAGKTALALATAATAAESGFPVGLFSLEIGQDQVAMRMIAGRAKVDVQRLRMGTLERPDWDRAQTVAEGLNGLPIYVDDSPRMTVDSLRQRALTLGYRHDVRLLVVDYVQLLTSPQSTGSRGGSRTYEVADISTNLKALAREMRVPVLACCQLNREVERQPNRKPTLANLRDSGQLEQDADIVVLLHATRNEDDPLAKVPVGVDVAKHRNGPVGEFQLLFTPRSARFDNLARAFP